MVAPNAPNPANPNVQDQDANAVQGPTNQAQGPMVQNQAQGPSVQNPVQGPANQNQAQVPAGQILFQDPAQVDQNIPVQPLQQPVPIQPVPAGVVMPAPQIVYQNWIGKKPEFSGKPVTLPISYLDNSSQYLPFFSFKNV